MSLRALAELCRSSAHRPVMGRASRGIFGGKHIAFGNNVSHSKRRTRRSWKPNVQKKTYYSEVLDRELKINVTTHVIRCIDKVGSFDKFILTKDKLIKDSALALRLQEEMKHVLRQRQSEAAKAALKDP